MGYSISLTTGAASQNEGTPGAAASFSFTVTRQAGDSDGPYTYQFYDVATGGFNTTDFAAAAPFSFDPGVMTKTVTVTAAADSTVEASESFQLWLYIGGNPVSFLQSGNFTLVNDDAGPPVFTSSATFDAPENGTAVGTVVATGSGTVTYALNGGADAAQFAVDANTGVLTFLANNDYEAPDDAGANRVYNVTIRATGGGASTDQNVAVNLTNANEAVSISSNGGGATAAVNVVENTTAVLTAAVTDIDAGDTVAWSIAGGADASAFQVDAATGALSFVSGRNFESPTDSGANNTYVVNLRATDSGGLTDDQEVTVTVTNVAEAPIISSNGGGSFAVLHVPENTLTTTTLATVAATDGDGTTPTYAKAGGADQGLFAIDANTGILTFAASPNFEAPADANGDNLYEVVVRATDGALNDDQTLYIFVDNVIEAGVPSDVPGTPGTPPTPPTNLGDDYMPGTDGSDSRAGGPGNDTIEGGGGDDFLDGDAGNDYVYGGLGADFIRGLDGDDTIDGGDGGDDVNGNTGIDIVRGGEGDDTVRGGQGDDTVYGDAGNDGHVNGNIGDDIVRGGDGSDTVYGGQGNDTVYGEEGSDRLSGDLGADILYGGNGADRFVLRVGAGQDWVGDFSAAQGDRILMAPGTTYTVLNHQNQVVLALSDGSSIGLVGVTFSSFSATWVEFG